MSDIKVENIDRGASIKIIDKGRHTAVDQNQNRSSLSVKKHADNEVTSAKASGKRISKRGSFQLSATPMYLDFKPEMAKVKSIRRVVSNKGSREKLQTFQ